MVKIPIYQYECSYCGRQFEEFHKVNENSGKSWCDVCGNISFKLPSLAQPIIFKQRNFADGTKTPNNIRTFEQEEKWKKKEKIHYDKPTGKEKRHRKEEREKKGETAMEVAFTKAQKKINEGFRIKEAK